jgi:hypothetical protein
MSQPHWNSPSTAREVALAPQGGGSHGAFTWGVLDRMLEDDAIEIIGVTGTSAGAMNARRTRRRDGAGRSETGSHKAPSILGSNRQDSFLIWPMSGETAANTPLERPFMRDLSC